MNRIIPSLRLVALIALLMAVTFLVRNGRPPARGATRSGPATVQQAVAHDVSKTLGDRPSADRAHPGALAPDDDADDPDQQPPAPAAITPPVITVPEGAAAAEQTSHGEKPGPVLVESFDGLGGGFGGPQGTASLRNPSDNGLAVGPNHIVQVVNSRMAIFTKKGKQFDTSGKVLYGPVNTNNVFKGFGGTCETRNNGDAVVGYNQ